MTASTAESPAIEPVDVSVLRRAVAASMLGNATEWYDYGVYSYVAIEIGKNFFPGATRRSGRCWSSPSPSCFAPWAASCGDRWATGWGAPRSWPPRSC